LRRLVILACTGMLWWTSVAPAASGGEVVAPVGQPDRQRVIVVFKDAVTDPDTEAHELSRQFDARPEFVYRHALKGFVVEVPPQALPALARNPLVASVELDQVAHIAAQTLPTGIDRIEADQNPNPDIDGIDDLRIEVDIAVLDTGIDLDHPDLNITTTRATNCTVFPCLNGTDDDGNTGDDGNGHGTHVAGSAAALDNGIGPVGVAPGARLWSVKVLDNAGNGALSWIIAGIDWVTARADRIEVANMSLGCECPSLAMNTAITNSVAAGVVYTIAAGNFAKDASTFHPAAHPDVITVSALADFDGKAGGAAAHTCRVDEDDTLANFSNFGPLVEIAAPGVCIYSTWKNGGYNTINGTSMASPHTAGAAGLFIALNGRDRDGNAIINKADADAVRSSLIAAALPQSHQCGYTNERAAQGSNEPLLFINGAAFGGDGSCIAVDRPPSVVWVGPVNGGVVSGVVPIRVQASDGEDPAGSLTVEWRVNAGAWQPAPFNATSGYYEGSWDSTGVADGGHSLEARATDSAGQTGAQTISVTVSNTASEYAAAVLADSPIAYWRLGEASGTTAMDVTGTGHNATYRNSPILGVPGLIDADPDTAVSFDGTDDRVGVPDATDINTGGPYPTRTVELWFKPDRVTKRQVLYEQGGTSTGLGIYLYSGQVYVIGWSSGWGPLWVSAAVTTNTRYHVVLVLDQPGSRLEGFLNGTSMGIATGAGQLQTTTDNIAIAAMEQHTRFHDGPVTGAANYHFDGIVDEVALYGAALTTTQIQNHHTIGTGASPPSDSPPSVVWVGPVNGGVVSGVVPIRVQASDGEDPAGSLTVEWRVNAGAWQPAPFNATSGYYEGSWDSTGVADGGHSLEARATDSAGQTGAQTISVTVSNTASEYAAAVLADSPIAYWRLGEASGTTAMDVTGTGHNATYRNSPILGVPGLIDADPDTAVSFDGTDDRVGVPDATDINTGGPYPTRTVELWFKPDRVTKRQVLYEQGGTSTGLGIYLYSGQVYVIGWSSGWGPLWVSAAVTTNTRYHVVLVLDQPGSRLEGFLNGTSMGIATGAGQLQTTTDNIAIAAMEQHTRFHDGPVTGAANYHFDGIVDEVALYGAALTTTQIQNHHTIGTGGA
jgi:subtilisin family serine protease